MLLFKQFLKEWEKLQKVPNTQYGSNRGGIHIDENGQKHYVKFYNNDQQAKSEVLAGHIYNHMGIHTLKPSYHKINGKHAVITHWNNNLKQKNKTFFETPNETHAKQIGRMYHAAILTKNWDVIGLDHDNIMHNSKTHNLHAIDHGGTFEFRARGGHKNYGSDIDEHKSLRYNDSPSGHVFKHAFMTHPSAEYHGLNAVRSMNDNHVHHLFKNSGLKNWKSLHHNFMKRKEALLKHYE